MFGRKRIAKLERKAEIFKKWWEDRYNDWEKSQGELNRARLTLAEVRAELEKEKAKPKYYKTKES